MYFFKTWKHVPTLLLLHFTLELALVQGYMVGNNPYHRAEILDPQGKYRLEWLINLERKRVTFNVTVETTGYVGFGLSSYGKMSGADIVLGGVNKDGSLYFSDTHAVGHQTPEVDTSQDWVLHSAREDGTHTFLSFSRAFDTCDDQDYPITEDKISLIWAYGERDTIRYHHGNRGEYPVYLINPDYAPLITRDPKTDNVISVGGEAVGGQSDIKVWSIKTSFAMPEDETTYWCTMHRGPRLSRKHHAIGFDVRFPNPEGLRHTHHFLLHKCHAPAGSDGRRMFEQWTTHQGQRCFAVKAPKGPMPTEYCSEYAQAWGVGGRAWFHPGNMGLPIGDTPDEYYLLQIHYDNPRGLDGVVVESSVDIFYTSSIGTVDSGLMVVRHESPGLPPSVLVPPNTFEQMSYGMCSPACTRKILPAGGITIYGVFLHSHDAGKKMRLHHFRNNKELPWIASDDTFAFGYQQFRILNRPVKVLPGDQLVFRCTYESTRANGTVVSGFSTRQEMCAAWFVYHSKLEDYQICSSEIDSPAYRQRLLGVTNVTWSDHRLEYVVDPPHRLAGLTITEVSNNHVNWNLARREELQRFQLNHPHVNRCPTELYALKRDEDGRLSDRLSDVLGDPLTMVSYPNRATPYKPKQSCSFQGN